MSPDPAGDKSKARPWYEGENRDALFYLLVAVFFLELIVGGVAFFYGIVRAAPETPGGPPIARFPWLGWIISAVSAPAAFLLIVHAAGSLLAGKPAPEVNGGDEFVPERAKRFYAAVRHAPAIVVLGALLALGAALFFIDGAFRLLVDFGSALAPHIPWLAGACCGLLAFCFAARAFLAYQRRKLELEHEWRREVLEKTGLIITSKREALDPAAIKPLPRPAPPAIQARVIDVSSNEDEKDPPE